MADGDSTGTAQGELGSPHSNPHLVYNVMDVSALSRIGIVIEMEIGVELVVDGELENESDVLDGQVGAAFSARYCAHDGDLGKRSGVFQQIIGDTGLR